MRARRLMWRLYPSYLVITLGTVLLVTWHATSVLKTFHIQQVQHDLTVLTRSWETELGRRILQDDAEALTRFCADQAARAGVHVTVLAATGQVLADSVPAPVRAEAAGASPEVQAAFAGDVGRAVRHDPVRGDDLAYVAVPLRVSGQPGVVVRTAVSLGPIRQELHALYTRIVAGSLLVALLAAAVVVFVSRRISRPLEILKVGAERFAGGDLHHRLVADGPYEIAALAESMNQMAEQLGEKINAAVRRRNERDAILTSMVEGVLAVDTRQSILSMNRSAAALFGVDTQTVPGKTLQETVRSPQLQRLVSDVLEQQNSVSDDFILYTDTERFLHVQGTVLRDAAGTLIGALVVIYDVTQIKRLENVRRDFVANVSHELKTPITSIKGYVETLLDGAMHDPDDAERFLRIVANQSDRLNSIIDDLLALSRVEQKAERAELALERDAIRPVLESAIEVSSANAVECGVQIELDCDVQLAARINAPLLEQAVANLIHNACKHSPPGATVWVGADQRGEEVVIRVRDVGCGIEAHHLPRVFERFYRVDKSRSRKLGGTGLGLAIVKHIAQAHHGQVHVESTPNVGSLFSISLPA